MTDAALDCLIIGAGPAGLTAATYLARFHRRIALVSAGRSRATYIPVTHNCPGFPFGVSGSELLDRMAAQSAQFGVVPIDARVRHLLRSPAGFVAESDRQRWLAQTVLLATGVVDRLPPVPGIERGIADMVIRLCAVCDGYEASDHRIAVYGPPPTVIGHACFLRTYSKRVTAILSEPGELSRNDRERAAALALTVLPPPRAIKLVSDDDGKVQVCRVSWPDRQEDFDSFYPVLGSDAKAGLGMSLGTRVDADGELIVDENLQTSVDGLYAAGDVVNTLNQISVAVGQAAIAATAIHRRLSSNAL